MRRRALKGVLISLSTLVVGCAADLRRTPVIMVAGKPSEQAVLKVSEDVRVTLSSGYNRLIASGSEWRSIGHVSAGTVYQPVGHVFSIEGAHVHEAYLVLREGFLVGFYLPGEGNMNVLEPPIKVKME